MQAFQSRASVGRVARVVGRQACAKHSWVSPLSANEMHCLEMVGMRNEDLAFGNSVRSLGVLRTLTSSLSSRAGGRNRQMSDMIRNGRVSAYQKMLQEVEASGADGVVGVSTSIGPLSGLVEFSSYGGAVTRIAKEPPSSPPGDKDKAKDKKPFAATCSGEQYYCMAEAGFQPRCVVFGNEAYSAGLVGFIAGSFRRMLTGEVRSYSDVFNRARSTALSKLREDAFNQGCNFVSGVKLSAVRLTFIQEVSFVGTGCYHPNLPEPTSPDEVITSALPEEELWSLLAIGRRPISIITGCSVYNLGFGRAFVGSLQQLKGGEASRYTDLTRRARENVMQQIRQQAEQVGADDVVSVRIHYEQIRPGTVEFFAYGTAVKHDASISLSRSSLPPQVLMGSRKQFYSTQSLLRNSFGAVSSTGHSSVTESENSLYNSISGFIKYFGYFLKQLVRGIVTILANIFPFIGRVLERSAAKKG